MINPVCATCGRKVWGNYGDGKWRHFGVLGIPNLTTICKGKPIQPKESK